MWALNGPRLGICAFPLPYVLTNVTTACALGGNFNNEDDHDLACPPPKIYGGEFVPRNQAVIHSYICASVMPAAAR